MNAAHIIGKKRNRLGRLQKKLSDKDMGGEQRNRVSARISELASEIPTKK